MPIEFVSSPSNSQVGRRFEEKEPEQGLFWWVIAIIVLTGVAVFSWVFSIYVFSYPEKPFNYKLLTKLEKIDPVQQFPRLGVPGGRENSAKQIYAKFYDYDATLTAVKNDGLKRSYLWNYSEESPIYVTGKFEVTESRNLSQSDVFTTGVVVRAKSLDYPNAFLEFIFPTGEAGAPSEHFQPGDTLNLEKSRTYAAVLNLEWLNDDDLLISAVSLVYGRHRTNDTQFINQAPPTRLNMEGTWPITGLAPADPIAKEEPDPDVPDDPPAAEAANPAS